MSFIFIFILFFNDSFFIYFLCLLFTRARVIYKLNLKNFSNGKSIKKILPKKRLEKEPKNVFVQKNGEQQQKQAMKINLNKFLFCADSSRAVVLNTVNYKVC